MILYIILSYMLMGTYCIYKSCETKKTKSWFKAWLVSPLSMPIFLIVNFINW